MSLFNITYLDQPKPITVFELQERITLDNFAELEQVVRTEYSKGTRSAIIDIAEVPTLTSIAVRGLVVMHKILSTSGGSALKIAGASPAVQEVLQIAGITQFIDIYNTVESAVASFR